MANGDKNKTITEAREKGKIINKPSESILSKLGGAVSDATSDISKGSTFSRFSKGVKDFYKPITDLVTPTPLQKPVTNLKSNKPGDLDVTYDETLPLKDQFAINPNPFEINKETGKARVKPDHFTQNSTILDEHVVDSSDPKTSKYNELRNSMPKPTGKPPIKVQAAEKQILDRKDLKANQQQVDKLNNDNDVITNYSEEDNSLQNLENKF